ncbi:TIGR02206 family membrane protein [Cohnella pontilimi]|uniref:TIGR02206 family membrane protein n=1 Tax=Cohnella pontilimi TaxID=2564100 RepID=A0A4V5LSW1_9BACL|nr:TIGR02206 family membrane protein [Cohnella pontilimi]TJY44499.1 TIGR02206 family membrane protein [Cohnella pontilimi]
MAFVPFTAAHWAGIVFAIAAAALIIGFRNLIRVEARDRKLRLSLAAILIGTELSLYTWYGVTDNWGLHALPFQLCTITLWVSAITLITRCRKLYDIAFFLGILGATQALLTPNLDETFPNFRYFHFFIAHAAIVGAGVYMAVIDGYRPNLRSVWRAWGWLNGFALAAGIANKATGENFMFVARKPDTASLLDLLPPWPWYLLELEIIALALCMLLLGIARFSGRVFGKRNTQIEVYGEDVVK